MMATETPLKYSKKTIRIATTALFVAQGLCFATFASRLPDIKSEFNVESFLHYGFLMFLLPLGKFIAIPLVGILLKILGTKKTVLLSILPYAIALFLVAIIPGIYGLGLSLFIFGIFWNMTDISLNTEAIEVERVYEKPIIATFHASWSFSAVVGALIGYVMINSEIVPFYHFLLMSIVGITIIFIAYKFIPSFAPKVETKLKEAPVKKGFKMPEMLLIQLGLVWLIGLIVENTMFEWSDVYFQSVIQAPKSLQVGFLVFMIMMFAGRLLTSLAYKFLEKTTILQIAGGLILLGFLTSSMFIGYSDSMTSKVVINSLGFMLIGLGISCVVPTLYSIVAEKAKTPAGTALTIMSSISFVGPLIAPLMVGGISQHFGLRWAYLVVGLFGTVIFLVPFFMNRKK